jgi:hypothetical protein
MAGLTGKVFTLSGKVGGARTPHPHLVVIELSDRCWLIPAFTTGGYEIEEYKRNIFPALGLRPDQAFAEIDNALHVRFYDSRPHNQATWVVERAEPWPKSELNRWQPIGEMDAAGLLQIAMTFVALIEARPNEFSPHLRKRVAKLVVELQS